MKLRGLYLIADTAQLVEKNMEGYIASLIEAGVSMIQFRDKAPNTTNECKQLAQAIQAQCQDYNIPFIINDDVALAVAMDADGVHLGKDDMGVLDARRCLGINKYIGVSCYASAARAKQAQQDGADYVAFGAVFKSTTNPKAPCLGSSTEQSLQALKELKAGVDIPVCAIGGITPNNAKQVIECGVQFIAVASGILAVADPLQAVKRYQVFH